MIKTNKIDDGHANLFQMHSTNKKKKSMMGDQRLGDSLISTEISKIYTMSLIKNTRQWVFSALLTQIFLLILNITKPYTLNQTECANLKIDFLLIEWYEKQEEVI